MINDCPKHRPVNRILKKCVEFKIYFLIFFELYKTLVYNKSLGFEIESQKMEKKEKTVEALGFYYGTRILDFLINF